MLRRRRRTGKNAAVEQTQRHQIISPVRRAGHAGDVLPPDFALCQADASSAESLAHVRSIPVQSLPALAVGDGPSLQRWPGGRAVAASREICVVRCRITTQRCKLDNVLQHPLCSPSRSLGSAVAIVSLPTMNHCQVAVTSRSRPRSDAVLPSIEEAFGRQC